MNDLSFFLKFSVLPKEIKEEIWQYLEKITILKKNNSKKPNRKAGFLLGTFEMTKDFDEPLEDFNDYM